jgi:hypothetical protein
MRLREPNTTHSTARNIRRIRNTILHRGASHAPV